MKRYLFAALFLVAGGIAIYLAFYAGGEIAEKRAWPTVSGKILERKPLKYVYEVNGKKYINGQVHLVESDDEDQATIDKLPDPVPVHYDPKHPGDSFLLVNSSGPRWLLVLAGAFAILMGLAQLFVAVKARPRTSDHRS